MRHTVKILIILCFLTLQNCIIYDYFNEPDITGIWIQTARKCNKNGACELKEDKIKLTLRSDKTVTLASKSDTAHFFYNGKLFYRVYSRDNKICFAFEIISLSKNEMLMMIYDEDLNKKDIYKFKKLATSQ